MNYDSDRRNSDLQKLYAMRKEIQNIQNVDKEMEALKKRKAQSLEESTRVNIQPPVKSEDEVRNTYKDNLLEKHKKARITLSVIYCIICVVVGVLFAIHTSSVEVDHKLLFTVLAEIDMLVIMIMAIVFSS